MGENSLIPPDFTSTLVKMAKFRNRLVHRYWDVDTEFLYSILCDNLSDLARFLVEIRAGLKGNS